MSSPESGSTLTSLVVKKLTTHIEDPVAENLDVEFTSPPNEMVFNRVKASITEECDDKTWQIVLKDFGNGLSQAVLALDQDPQGDNAKIRADAPSAGLEPCIREGCQV